MKALARNYAEAFNMTAVPIVKLLSPILLIGLVVGLYLWAVQGNPELLIGLFWVTTICTACVGYVCLAAAIWMRHD